MTIRIGASGYNDPEWRASFYPERFPTGKMLPCYAEDPRVIRAILAHGLGMRTGGLPAEVPHPDLPSPPPAHATGRAADVFA